MATILFDRETRRSRGIGFVTFNKDEDAQKVVDMALSEEGINFNDRRLKVVFAEKREPRPATN
jgi:RNA recognition motif-containing protein